MPNRHFKRAKEAVWTLPSQWPHYQSRHITEHLKPSLSSAVAQLVCVHCQPIVTEHWASLLEPLKFLPLEIGFSVGLPLAFSPEWFPTKVLFVSLDSGENWHAHICWWRLFYCQCDSYQGIWEKYLVFSVFILEAGLFFPARFPHKAGHSSSIEKGFRCWADKN